MPTLIRNSLACWLNATAAFIAAVALLLTVLATLPLIVLAAYLEETTLPRHVKVSLACDNWVRTILFGASEGRRS